MKLARVASMAAVFSTVAALWIPSIPARAGDMAPANSRQSMNQVVHQLDVDGIALTKVLDFLRNVSGANIVVNWKTLEAAGVMRETPITLRVRELTLRKMLQLVLSQASPNAPLSYGVDANVIQITTQEDLDKQLITKVYIVDDLVMPTNNNVQAPRINLSNIGGSSGGSSGGSYGGGGGRTGGGGFGGGGGGFGGGGGGGYGGGGSGGYGGGSSGSGGGIFGNSTNNNTTNQPQQTPDQKGQELVDLIKNVIRPNIWKENGGTAEIKYYSGKLIVTAPVSVQEAIGGPVGDTGIRFGM